MKLILIIIYLTPFFLLYPQSIIDEESYSSNEDAAISDSLFYYKGNEKYSFFSEIKSKLNSSRGEQDSVYFGTRHQQISKFKLKNENFTFNSFLRKKEYELTDYGQFYYSLQYNWHNQSIFAGLQRINGLSGFFLNKNSTYLKLRNSTNSHFFSPSSSPFYNLNFNGTGASFNLKNSNFTFFTGQNSWTVNLSENKQITKINFNAPELKESEIYETKSSFKYYCGSYSIDNLLQHYSLQLGMHFLKSKDLEFSYFGKSLLLYETSLFYNYNNFLTRLYFLHNSHKPAYLGIFNYKVLDFKGELQLYRQNQNRLDPFNSKLSYEAKSLTCLNINFKKTLLSARLISSINYLYEVYTGKNNNPYLTNPVEISNNKFKVEAHYKLSKSHKIYSSVYFKSKYQEENEKQEQYFQPVSGIEISKSNITVKLSPSLIIKNSKIIGNLLNLNWRYTYKKYKLKISTYLFSTDIPFYITKSGIGYYNENLILSGKGSYFDVKFEFKNHYFTSWLGFSKINYSDRDTCYSGYEEIDSPSAHKIAFGLKTQLQ